MTSNEYQRSLHTSASHDVGKTRYNNIRFPTALEMLDDDKFRFQRLQYAGAYVKEWNTNILGASQFHRISQPRFRIYIPHTWHFPTTISARSQVLVDSVSDCEELRQTQRC